MKKILFSVVYCAVFASVLAGCGDKKDKESKGESATVIRKAESHAGWIIAQIAKGDVKSVERWVYAPKGGDKTALSNAVKEYVDSQKAQIDAAGGIEKVSLVNITAKMSVKYKNSQNPIERSITMIKTGPEDYKIVLPGKISNGNK